MKVALALVRLTGVGAPCLTSLFELPVASIQVVVVLALPLQAERVPQTARHEPLVLLLADALDVVPGPHRLEPPAVPRRAAVLAASALVRLVVEPVELAPAEHEDREEDEGEELAGHLEPPLG